jgi:hypothetical protein
MKTLLALISLSLLAISGNVAAEGFKPPTDQFHSGSDCKNYYRSDSSRFNHEVWGIVNLGKGPGNIICPIVNTEPFFAGGTTDGIRVLAAGTGTVSCTVYSHDSNMNITNSQTASKTGGGWFVIPDVIQKGKFGSYTMSCSLPQYGWLQAYQVRLRVNF